MPMASISAKQATTPKKMAPRAMYTTTVKLLGLRYMPKTEIKNNTMDTAAKMTNARGWNMDFLQLIELPTTIAHLRTIVNVDTTIYLTKIPA